MQTIIKAKSIIEKPASKSFGSDHFIHSKPVIKLSRDGILLYANNAGVEFLELVSNTLKAPAITYLIKNNPGILEAGCFKDISFRVNQMKFYFSAVSFDEAGYIGLYAYRVMHINIAGNMVA